MYRLIKNQATDTTVAAKIVSFTSYIYTELVNLTVLSCNSCWSTHPIRARSSVSRAISEVDTRGIMNDSVTVFPDRIYSICDTQPQFIVKKVKKKNQESNECN